MKISNELKTGAVIFTAILVFIVILFKTGDLSTGKKGYTVMARLNFAAGVKKFSPVRLAGVEVGEVKDLRLIYDPDKTVVEAVIWVSDGVKLRKDSLAIVSTLGLMGEKYIEIKAGTASDFVGPGEMLEAKDPVSMEDLFEQFQDLGQEFKLTLVDARKVLGNFNGVLDENKPKLARMMDNLEGTTEYFLEFAEDVKYHPWKVLAKGKEMTPAELEKARAERKAKKLGITVAPAESTEAGKTSNFAAKGKK